jgi:hypothetical protein
MDSYDAVDRKAEEWTARKLREIELRPLVKNATALLEAALDEPDLQTRREAIRMGITTLREVEESAPELLDHLGYDRAEFNALARDVGLPEVEPLGPRLREGEDITRVRQQWRAGGVRSLRENGTYAMVAACRGFAEDAGIDPAALSPHSGADGGLLARMGMDWDQS